MFIACLTIFFSILSPLQAVSYVKVHVYCVFDYFLFNLVSTSVGELRESVCLLCVWLFSLQSCLHLLQRVSYIKVHVYCVFDYFLFNLVSTSVGELRESACLLCVWLFSLQSCLHFGELLWKCMFIVCLTIFFSILSPLQIGELRESVHVYCVFDYFTLQSCLLFSMVSYVKVNVYCVFDYFLFNLVSTSGGELCKSACLLRVWLFSLQSCLHFQVVSYVKVYVYCVFDYLLFNFVSNLACELHESACLLCVWLFSLQSWSQLQRVSYVKVHVYCVFDYFLFNLVSTSLQEAPVSYMTKCMFIVCLTIFSSILSPLQEVSYIKSAYTLINSPAEFGDKIELQYFSRWVTWKCMFIVCLTIFFSISPLQAVSYVKVHVYCVFDYFLFNLVSNLACELHESACLLCVWLFSLQSCHSAGEFSEWLWVSLSSFFVKVHVYCVFDYFLFNLVSTSGGELYESAFLLCVWLFSL